MLASNHIMQEEMHFGSLQTWSYSILGLLSFVSGVFVLWAYLKQRTLRETPGLLVLWICISLMCLSCYFVYIGFYFLITQSLPDSDSCFLHGIVTSYFTFLSWNYAAVLGLELSKSRSSQTQICYHVFAHGLAGAMTLCLVLNSAVGLSINNTCFIKRDTWGESFALLFVVYLPLFAVGILKPLVWKRKKYTRVCVLLLVYCLMMLPTAVNYLIAFFGGGYFVPILSQLSILFRSCMGVVVCSIRLWSFEFKQVSRRFYESEIEAPVGFT